MSGFSLEWLRLREPFDAAARDPELTRRFAATLPMGPRLLDLGAGSGANPRFLAGRLGRPQEWLLVDGDAELLAAAEGSSDDASWRVTTLQLDLARELDRLDFAEFDGIVASALLDLVSAAWLDDLAARLVAARRPILVTLTIDGRIAWRPPAIEDALVATAFARHQQRDKGFGPALGAAAAAHLARRLAAAGYEVATAHSDWQVGSAEVTMLLAVISGFAAAAHEAAPDQSGTIAAWTAHRQAAARAGALSLMLGHVDLLGVPA